MRTRTSPPSFLHKVSCHHMVTIRFSGNQEVGIPGKEAIANEDAKTTSTQELGGRVGRGGGQKVRTGTGTQRAGARQTGPIQELHRFRPCAKSWWVRMEQGQDRWLEIPKIRACKCVDNCALRKKKMGMLTWFSPSCVLGRPYVGNLPSIVLMNPQPAHAECERSD